MDSDELDLGSEYGKLEVKELKEDCNNFLLTCWLTVADRREDVIFDSGDHRIFIKMDDMRAP